MMYVIVALHSFNWVRVQHAALFRSLSVCVRNNKKHKHTILRMRSRQRKVPLSEKVEVIALQKKTLRFDVSFGLIYVLEIA